MYRLKALPNGSTPESLSNPQDVQVNVHALTPAYPSHVSSSPAAFLAAQPTRFTHIVAAGAVFWSPSVQHNAPASSSAEPTGPYLLLVQRAASDTYPLHWELPGGMADPSDPTLYDAVAREIKEETGLLVEEVRGQVLPAEVFNTGWYKRMKRWIKITFVLEVRDNSNGGGYIESDGEEGGHGGVCLEKEKKEIYVGEKDTALTATTTKDATDDKQKDVSETLEVAKTNDDDNSNNNNAIDKETAEVARISADRLAYLSALSTSANNVNMIPHIKLNPKEHEAYLWVTEEEIRENYVMGMPLLFVCQEQVDTFINAFDLRRDLHGQDEQRK